MPSDFFYFYCLRITEKDKNNVGKKILENTKILTFRDGHGAEKIIARGPHNQHAT